LAATPPLPPLRKGGLEGCGGNEIEHDAEHARIVRRARQHFAVQLEVVFGGRRFEKRGNGFAFARDGAEDSLGAGARRFALELELADVGNAQLEMYEIARDFEVAHGGFGHAFEPFDLADRFAGFVLEAHEPQVSGLVVFHDNDFPIADEAVVAGVKRKGGRGDHDESCEGAHGGPILLTSPQRQQGPPLLALRAAGITLLTPRRVGGIKIHETFDGAWG